MGGSYDISISNTEGIVWCCIVIGEVYYFPIEENWTIKFWTAKKPGWYLWKQFKWIGKPPTWKTKTKLTNWLYYFNYNYKVTPHSPVSSFTSMLYWCICSPIIWIKSDGVSQHFLFFNSTYNRVKNRTKFEKQLLYYNRHNFLQLLGLTEIDWLETQKYNES